ncbi:hypothetical protein BDW22DRAFT_241408 [Trametopsis cervina]|nr:hypothetical protein BDW22DRAFT_241408 [Trametopsis cervina]
MIFNFSRAPSVPTLASIFPIGPASPCGSCWICGHPDPVSLPQTLSRFRTRVVPRQRNKVSRPAFPLFDHCGIVAPQHSSRPPNMVSTPWRQLMRLHPDSSCAAPYKGQPARPLSSGA